HLYLGLGCLDYEWNDLESAEHHLQASIKRVTVREQSWVLIDGFTALARIRRTKGDEAGARALFRQAEEAVDAVDVAWAAPFMAPARARLALAQGQVARADRALREAGPTGDDQPGLWSVIWQTIAARILLALGMPDAALAVLEPLGSSAVA